MEKGRVTLPSEENYYDETMAVAKKWKADAIRDSDGTKLDKQIKNSGLKIYNAYFPTRAHNDFIQEHMEECPQIYLMSDRILSKETSLTIAFMKTYYPDQLVPNYRDNPKKYWEVIDRTTGEVIDASLWTIDQEQHRVMIKATTPWHEYTVSFLAYIIFVYDAEKMDWFHDEVFKDKVYFMNNVFYNTSTTTPTKWYRKDGALNHAVFSNNAFFETGGEHSPQEPNDPKKITANPQFVGNPLNYKQGNGVQNISNSAAIFKLKETSPLIDAGRYHRSLGTTDFFETQLYYGTAPDIGIHEYIQGEKVENPIDDQPIEIEKDREKENLAYKKPITANYTHPHNNYYYSADNLVDHDTTTRWAAPDPELMTEGYPIKIEIDFEKNTKFDEVYLDEFSDSGTNLRIQSFELQKLTRDGEWETFTKRDDGMGHDLTLNDFGEIESAKLRLLITSQKPTEYYTPSMTEIQVYSSNSQIGSEASISPHVFVYDQNPAMRQDSNNQIQFLVDVADDEFTSIRYIGSEGNVLGSLNEGVDYQFDGQVMNISSTFLTSKEVGSAGLQFEFKSGKAIKTTMELTDTTMLCERINEGEKLSAKNDQLKQALIEAKTVLAKVNRETTAMGNDQVTHKEVVEAEMALAKAITESQNINDTSIQTNANPITNKQIKGHRLASQYTQLF